MNIYLLTILCAKCNIVRPWTHTLPIMLLLIQRMFFIYYVTVIIFNLQLNYYLKCTHAIVSLANATRYCTYGTDTGVHVTCSISHSVILVNCLTGIIFPHIRYCALVVPSTTLSAVSLEVVASLHLRAVTCFSALHSLAGSFCLTLSTWCST